jgi:hypothetical protein
MDPNEVLLNMVAKARSIIALSDDTDTLSLADDVLEMHDHLSKGGHLPAAWKPGRVCGLQVTVHGGPDDGLTFHCRKDFDHPGEC